MLVQLLVLVQMIPDNTLIQRLTISSECFYFTKWVDSLLKVADKYPHYNINKKKLKCLDLRKLLTFVSSFTVSFIPSALQLSPVSQSLEAFSTEPRYLKKNAPSKYLRKGKLDWGTRPNQDRNTGYDFKSTGIRNIEQLWLLNYNIVK